MPIMLLVAVIGVVGAVVLAAVALVSRPTTTRVAAPAGLGAIEMFYASASTSASVPTTDPALVRPTLSGPLVITRRLAGALTPANVLIKIQHKLDVAGNPNGWTPERVLAFKGAGLIAIGLLGTLLGSKSGTGLLLGLPIGAVFGFFLPDILVHNTGTKRQQAMQRALPDALDMMTVCVEAGLGFDAAVSQVARNTQGPLAAELARMLQEQQFGKSRVEALRGLQERTTVPELSTFVTAVVQASKMGIPVANVLREQAVEMRLKRRQRAEEQAQKVTVKILFPLMFCLFPALMVVVIGPGAINIMHSFGGR